MTRDPKRILRKMAIWALLAPFLLSPLLSEGVMPASLHGGTVLVICTGYGPLKLVVDATVSRLLPRLGRALS